MIRERAGTAKTKAILGRTHHDILHTSVNLGPTALQCIFASIRDSWPDDRLHRVDRVLSFSPVVGIVTPLTRRRVCPPPFFSSGGRGTLAGERGGGRVLIPTRGHTLGYSINLIIYEPDPPFMRVTDWC